MGKEPGGTQKNAKGPREGEGKAGCRQGKWKGRGVGAERTRDTCTRKKSKSPGGNRTGLHSSSATDRPGFLAGNRIQLSGVGSSPSDRGEDGGDGGNAVATPVIAHHQTSMSSSTNEFIISETLHDLLCKEIMQTVRC